MTDATETQRVPTIVAIGGGGFLMDGDWKGEGSMEQFLVSLTAKPRPKVLFLGQAGGEDVYERMWFYKAFSNLPTPTYPMHLDLTRRTVVDLRSFILGFDLIYVGGGNSANMLAIWKIHGLTEILEEAWKAGIILSGMSAGAICWHSGGTTDSFGQALQPLAVADTLRFIGESCCPHFDTEEQRRTAFEALTKSGKVRTGIAIDDHVGVVYRGVNNIETIPNVPDIPQAAERTRIADVVTTRKGKAAYRHEYSVDAKDFVLTKLEARYIGP